MINDDNSGRVASDRATHEPNPQAVSALSGEYPSRFKIKMWRVSCAGFPAHLYYAASRGKALRDAWWGYCNYREVSFKTFLSIANCWREWPIDDDLFGQSMSVNGNPAFFVTRNNQYVRFAWPDSDTISNVHPYEVLPEHLRPWTYRDSDTHRMAETGTGSVRSMGSAGRSSGIAQPHPQSLLNQEKPK